MNGTKLFDFMKSEGQGLGIIGLVVFGLAILVVRGSRWLSMPSFSYTAVANLIVATVAVTSLYIAWRELIRKTRPNITIRYESEIQDNGEDYESLSMNVINSGENVLTPINAWYGLVGQMDDDFYFTNHEMGIFDERGLQSGEAAQLEIGSNVVLFRLKQVNIRDWKGSGVSIEDIDNDRVIQIGQGRVESDLQVKIQKIFEAILTVERGCGISVSPDEIRSSKVDELLEKYDLDNGVSMRPVSDYVESENEI